MLLPKESGDGDEVEPITVTSKLGSKLGAAAYVAVWIAASSTVILYNKYILHSLNFRIVTH